MSEYEEEKLTNIAQDPSGVPPAVGGYSHGIEVPKNSRWLYVSGQIPESIEGGVPDGFEAQCEAVWDNIEGVLRSADMDAGDLVKVTTFLTDPKHAESNSQIRRRRLGDAKPALTVVVAQTLDPEWLIEIEAVAASGD